MNRFFKVTRSRVTLVGDVVMSQWSSLFSSSAALFFSSEGQFRSFGLQTRTANFESGEREREGGGEEEGRI